MNKIDNKEKWLTIGAFAAIYIIWGSTYLFNKFAIETMPPFLMAGSRFFVAGLLMLLYLIIKGNIQWPSQRQILNASLVGIAFLTLGNGLVVWALQYIDTGVTALLIAFDPLLIILFMWLMNGEAPGRRNLFGTFLGIVGMVILIGQPQFVANQETIISLFLVLIALIAWAIASILIPSWDMPKNKIMGSAVQMLVGGGLMLLYGVITQEYQGVVLQDLSTKSLWSWVYLVTFGSIIAFSAFNYLLHKVSPDKVSTATYVNPIIALLLGWWFNNESLSMQSMIAAAILLVGVFFIRSHKTE